MPTKMLRKKKISTRKIRGGNTYKATAKRATEFNKRNSEKSQPEIPQPEIPQPEIPQPEIPEVNGPTTKENSKNKLSNDLFEQLSHVDTNKPDYAVFADFDKIISGMYPDAGFDYFTKKQKLFDCLEQYLEN